MSADNFIHVKRLPDGFRYTHLSASEYWGHPSWDIIELPDTAYTFGPFATLDELEAALETEYTEYGTHGWSTIKEERT